jgi:hypothetical protein
MARRYAMTPARRRALRKAQLASARARRRGSRMSTRKKVAVGAAVAGAGYYGYQKSRYVVMYHNTSHHQARQIVKNGFAGGKGRKGDPTKIWKQTASGYSDHEKGRVFFSVGYNHPIAKSFGSARLKTKVRRKDLKKFGRIDDHPAAKVNGIKNFYYFEASDLAGIKHRPRYTIPSRMRTKTKINKAYLSPIGDWEYPRLRRRI